jgi:hypothetical protein
MASRGDVLGGIMDGVTAGRIVHYVAYNKRCLAAIVIGVNEDQSADIVLFTNLENVNGDKNFGLQFHQEIHGSENKEPGTWHWPER